MLELGTSDNLTRLRYDERQLDVKEKLSESCVTLFPEPSRASRQMRLNASTGSL